MSHFSEVARPPMRRKSSAQNLLSSFKPSSASSSSTNLLAHPPPPPPPPPPPAIPASTSPPLNVTVNATGTGSVSSVSGLSLASALASAGALTPTVSTPMARGDSTPDMYGSDPMPANVVGTMSPPLGSSTSVEFLRELVQKRLITLTYVRNVHEGRSYWFHTLLVTRAELEKVFNNEAMKKRTYRFATLGLSLSNLLDINNPQDLLRSLLNIVTEYDQSKEENEKLKMRIFSKTKNVRRLGGSSISEFTGSESTSESSILMQPPMPFPLDYHETVLSLLDVVSEVYNKISKILGPSSLPHSHQSLGPLASITPYPGVSYLFTSHENNNSHPYFYSNTTPPNLTSSASYVVGSQSQSPYHNNSNPNLHQTVQFPNSAAAASTTTLTTSISGSGSGEGGSGYGDVAGSLWNIANASSVGMGVGTGGYFMPTNNWPPAHGEMILKIDTKLKKILSTLLKDLDAFARNGIRDELAALDPLLRNLGTSEEGVVNGKIVYDFEGQ